MEEGMATHSSTLACRIPQKEEPGGLQSMGRKESDMTERLTLSTSPPYRASKEFSTDAKVKRT